MEQLSQKANHLSYVALIRRSREILVSQIRNTQCLLDNLTENKYFSDEEAEIVLKFQTRSDKVRQILDQVESKGEEASEYFISVLQRVPEVYFDLQTWLHEIDFHVSQSMQSLPIIKKDPVTLYTKKLRHELCCDSKFVISYTEREEMLLQETYVNGVMELISERNENVGNVRDINYLFDENGVINENGETTFIFGDAGMGKTLLIQKMQNDWAKGEAYKDIKFFFRFRCRMFIFFDRNTLISLKDLLFTYNCCPDHEPEEVYRYILRFPETVLFTFDGFDEIHSDYDLNSVPEVSSPLHPTHPVALLKHLLSGKLLKGSRKVLTARTGCIIPGHAIRKKIMLRGFSTDNLRKYTSLFFKELDIQKRVENHLKANHNFSSLCSIPLFCWIIFKSYEHFYSMNDSHFSHSSVTLTDIFLLITEVYLNLSYKATQQVSTKSQAETYGNNKETLLAIGRLALNGMERSLFVFNQEDVEDLKIPESAFKLGFFKTVKKYNGLGNSSSFEFLHVTLQSFFAALLLVIDDEISCTDLLKYFNQCTHTSNHKSSPLLLSCVCTDRSNRGDPFKNNDHLQFINLFLCGLLSKSKENLLRSFVPSSNLKMKRKALKNQLAKSVKSHLKRLPRSPYMQYKRVHALTHFIWMARCISETQNEKVGKLAAKGISADYIKLSFCGAYSSDCAAISFILNHYRKNIALELDNNNINDYGIKELIPCFQILTVIRLSVNQISDEGVKVLYEELTKYKIISYLGLYKNLITDFGAKYVAKIIEECPKFKVLMIGYNCITAEGGVRIARAIQKSNSINDVGMWGNRIGDVGAKAFAEAIRNHTTLTKLSLADNEITSKGGKSLAAALEENSSLQIVWLTENKLTDEAVERFAEMLKVNRSLRHLWLVKNLITNQGANLLLEALEHNTVLEEIWLS